VFEDLDQWTITEEYLGTTSPHTYRFRRGEWDLFVKEIKENEREILKLLTPLRLRHVVSPSFPALLDKNILVSEYITGGPIQSKDLEAGLIRDFATLQNHFNSSEFLREPRTDDGGFFRNYLTRCFETGYNNLKALLMHGFPIVEDFVRVAQYLLATQDEIILEFSSMPFARQHHDFREGSILGENPQVIIDWGSSYGHGPFLYDLAPFLLNHPKNLEIFIQHSDICKNADRMTIERWLYTAACARFMSFFTYIREQTDCERVNDFEAFLAYHYQTYSSLLQ
jgi:hypothetical protein